MKILNLNARQGRAKYFATLLSLLIKNHKPDIITLQEISECYGRNRFSNIYGDSEHMLTDLRNEFMKDYHFEFAPRQSTWQPCELTDVSDVFDFGNLIMWKKTSFSKIGYSSPFIVGDHDSYDFVKPETMPVNIQSLMLRDKACGKILNVINVHGYYAGKGVGKGDNPIRSMQSERIVNIACEHMCVNPQIIVGDFNIRPNTVAFAKIADDLDMDEAITSFNFKTTRTPLYGLEKREIEPFASYVFYTKNVTAKNCLVYDKMLISDHAPIILEFEI